MTALEYNRNAFGPGSTPNALRGATVTCSFYVSALGGGALRCIYKAMESSAKVEGGVE